MTYTIERYLGIYMWFFMNTCYVMSLLSFFLLITGFTQSFLHFDVFKANHVTFMVLTSIIYLFTETLIIFFYVGTGVSIKEYTHEHHLDSGFHRRSLNIKRRVYPPQLLNMLFMMILFVLAGMVDLGKFPDWLYKVLFFICIVHFVKIKLIQNECFRDNTNVVLEMSGLPKVKV